MLKKAYLDSKKVTKFYDKDSIIDIEVEQAMASRYRLSSMIPRTKIVSDSFVSPSSNITDKAFLE